MIPREILKKIRQSGLRPNRLVTVSGSTCVSRVVFGVPPKTSSHELFQRKNSSQFHEGSGATPELARGTRALPNASNWLNLTIGSLPKLNGCNSVPCNRLAVAGAGFADDRAACADDAATRADGAASLANDAATCADGRANRADDRAGLADAAATRANDAATVANDRDAGADGRDRCADDAASLAGNRAVFAENAASVAERLYRNAAAGISFAKRASSSRNRQIYFSTP